MSRRSADRVRTWTFDLNMSWNYSLARMAEWSKAVDLRPTIIRCEGSNPSSCMSCLLSADGWALLVCCLPTAERCLSVGGLYVGDFFIKIYIFFFDIYFSNTYVCCLPTAERCSMNYTITVLFYILDTLYSSIVCRLLSVALYKHSTAFYS